MVTVYVCGISSEEDEEVVTRLTTSNGAPERPALRTKSMNSSSNGNTRVPAKVRPRREKNPLLEYEPSFSLPHLELLGIFCKRDNTDENHLNLYLLPRPRHTLLVQKGKSVS